ncbi:hypothetical protein Tco_0747905 [Tanacetum coccineum]|uniref:RNA-directed DNA polymerase, eukaryota n=1 Tax=Tanacetum coccineum TaxID=301880 RepID=A0ABQ4YU13_9ASTR
MKRLPTHWLYRSLNSPFQILRVYVGVNMLDLNAWDDMVGKIKSRLSKWKINTLSIGGRLTLLKAVLGSTLIYPMSLYKVPKTVLHEMESLRRNFFNGVQGVDRKISWVKWTKVLASKKYGGLGVSSFYAPNRALLFRWVWRFLSHDNSLWFPFSFLPCMVLFPDSLFFPFVRMGINLASGKDLCCGVKCKGETIALFVAMSGRCGKLTARKTVRILVRSKEDTSHLFFSCDVALDISRLICRWWNVSWSPVDSYSGWLEWFNSIRMGSKLKGS